MPMRGNEFRIYMDAQDEHGSRPISLLLYKAGIEACSRLAKTGAIGELTADRDLYLSYL